MPDRASVNGTLVPPTLYVPTAVHDVADAHDVATSAAETEAAGFAGVCNDQVAPFHASASGLTVVAVEAAPTATQDVLAVHATPMSRSPVAAVALGVVCTDHVVPLLASASVACVPLLFVKSPTALQALAAVHETLVSSLWNEPLGFGVATVVQPEPFHDSAKVTSWWVVGEKYWPTDVHAVVALQETPKSELSATPEPALGSGVGWIDQLVPFHLSASVTPTVSTLPMPDDPTAVHAVADVHDTASNTLCVAPLGFGVLWIVHTDPFQRSASVTGVPTLFHDSPTAVQLVGDRHETPNSSFDREPLGFAEGWVDHVEPFRACVNVRCWPDALS